MELVSKTHHVRKAVKDDCPQIMELLKMLTRYLKLEDIFSMDFDTLVRDAFPANEPPRIECLVSDDENNKLSGYCIYCYNYSTWAGPFLLVLNLYIKPEFRKMKIALKFVSKLIKLAHSDNISQIVLPILQWNKTSIDFHESLGAVNLTHEEGLNIFMFEKNNIQLLADKNMKSNGETHQVREAVKDDCHQIMELIKMLARDENKEDSVKIDANTLIRDGFTENETPKFKCLVSYDDNYQLSGYLIYCNTYSPYRGRSIHIVELFVVPQFRRMGIGKKMMIKLAQIASADNVVYIDLYISNRNKAAIDFYQSLGAALNCLYCVFRGDRDGMQKLAANLNDL